MRRRKNGGNNGDDIHDHRPTHLSILGTTSTRSKVMFSTIPLPTAIGGLGLVVEFSY